MIRLQAAR